MKSDVPQTWNTREPAKERRGGGFGIRHHGRELESLLLVPLIVEMFDNALLLQRFGPTDGYHSYQNLPLLKWD